MRAYRFCGACIVLAIMVGGVAGAAEYKYRIRKQICQMDDSCQTGGSSDASPQFGLAATQGNPAAMNITGGSSPGANVVFTISNTGELASGAMTVSLTGDTGNFSKTADTCNGQTLAASATCSITIQPVATENGSYTGTLQVSGTPGGTVSQALSGTASGFVVDPGTVVPDGSVYAGLSPDGNVPMYVTRCDAGMSWDGSACTGMRSGISWNNGTDYGSPYDCSNWGCTGTTSVTTGKSNTATIAGLMGLGSPHQAAKYCQDLVEDGKTDWYLPARDELNVLYTNRVAIGGFDLSGSYPLGYYWASSETNLYYAAWAQRFSNAYQHDTSKYYGLSVRCARTDTVAELGMTVPQGDPAAMDITGGSSPGDDVVFTITNTGELASGTMTVSLTGDTGNFSKTADTCNGQALAASASCSITIQPVATENGSYTGTLQVSGTPGGTVSQALSGTAIGFVATPELSLTPATDVLNVVGSSYGTWAYGSPVTYTVQNCVGCGTAHAVLSTLSSTTNFEFVVGSNTCIGDDLADGASCTFQLRSKADRNQTLTPSDLVISSSDADSVVRPLSGTATGFVSPFIVYLWNSSGVNVGNPPTVLTFTLAQRTVVTSVQAYQYAPGVIIPDNTIGFVGTNSYEFMIPSFGVACQGGGGYCGAVGEYSTVVEAGTYTVTNAQSATWSWNGSSGNRGFLQVRGYPAP